MLKIYLHFTVALSFFLICNQKLYAASGQSFGTLGANVIDAASISSDEIEIYLTQKQKALSDNGTQNDWSFFEGSVIYKVESEPHSSVGVVYESANNSSSLTGYFKESYEFDSDDGEIQIKYDKTTITRLNFDEKGFSNLKLNPGFFIKDGSNNNKNYRAVYYVTIFY